MSDNRLSEFIDHCRDTMSRRDIRAELLGRWALRPLLRERFTDLTGESSRRAALSGDPSSAELVTQIQGRARRTALKEAMERKAA